MKMSDIFDIPIVLVENGHYYELVFNTYMLDGFDDFPILTFLAKGDEIPRNKLTKYEG